MHTRPKNISRNAGVYIFRRGRIPLYVGKAANLRQRVASYFAQDGGRTPKVKRMLEEATRLETVETASEIEALIREAELIKKYRPKYNLLMRDDKSYFYVAISREQFPRIFITHEPRQMVPGAGHQARGASRRPVLSAYSLVPRHIGPFTDGSALRAALKALRRVFPYCTCVRPHTRPCLNSEIGRCPRYCCLLPAERPRTNAKRQRAEYRKNIRNVIAVLSGSRTRLIGRLKGEMKVAVKKERYEEAARLRDAIFGLEAVFAHRHVLHTPGAPRPWPLLLGTLKRLLKTERDIHRIEGYDISNISGTSATGSMVVFTNGQLDKGQYRKFRIKTIGGSNDVAMFREVLERRFRHSEWPFPQLVVIDGGKAQLYVALKTIHDSKFMIHDSPLLVTALAKREEILFTADGRAIPLQRHDPAILHLFQRIRDESHRFARRYHHALRKRSYAAAR